jgi:8-oxo-dGTP diphosphatase
MQEYVVGFLFDENYQKVVLIQKNKPDWQKGKLNGVGGKIEPGETSMDAMVREFEEETGLTTLVWENFASITGNGFVVHFFFGQVNEERFYSVRSTTDEKVDIFKVAQIENLNVIPNLRWLIPMALSMKYDNAQSFEVTEVYA